MCVMILTLAYYVCLDTGAQTTTFVHTLTGEHKQCQSQEVTELCKRKGINLCCD